MRVSPYLYLLLICLAALAGCASTRDYESVAPKNLTIRPEVDAGSFFSSTSRGAQLEVYRITSKCALEYLGTVDLEDKPVQIGLETGRKLYLRFLFAQTGGGRAATTIPWGTLVTPRPGAQYLARIRFADGMYEVNLQEVNSRGAALHEFQRTAPPCPESD